MAGELLLDTCAIIAFIRSDPAVAVRIRSTSQNYFSIVSHGELRFGALLSLRVADNLWQIEAFGTTCVMLNADKATAVLYADIKNQLKTKGRMIPDNDLWIAATAIQHSLPLLTNDQHFRAVDGLTLETW